MTNMKISSKLGKLGVFFNRHAQKKLELQSNLEFLKQSQRTILILSCELNGIKKSNQRGLELFSTSFQNIRVANKLINGENKEDQIQLPPNQTS